MALFMWTDHALMARHRLQACAQDMAGLSLYSIMTAICKRQQKVGLRRGREASMGQNCGASSRLPASLILGRQSKLIVSLCSKGRSATKPGHRRRIASLPGPGLLSPLHWMTAHRE